MKVGERAVISVFAGGPKVQAIAAALFACADRRVQVKARIPKGYERRDVQQNGSYHLFRLVDLTSPACSLLDTWYEPRRVCRRPQLVRSRVYDKQNDEQIFS